MGAAPRGFLLLAAGMAAVARVGAITVKGFCDVKFVGNHTQYGHGKWVHGEVDEGDRQRASTCLNKQFSCGPNPKLLKSMSWRWSPDGCGLRPFDDGKFRQLLEGRKLWFFGDSMSMCMADSLTCLDIAHEQVRWDRLGIGSSLPDLGPSPLVSMVGNDATRAMSVHEQWKMLVERKEIQPQDVIVFNTGAHGLPAENREAELNSLAAAVSAAHRGLIFFRPTTIGHKACWDYDGPVESMSDAQYKAFTDDMYNWNEFHPINEYIIQSFQAVAADRFHVLDVSMFELRPDGHVSQVFHDNTDPENKFRKEDCLHYCVPGPIDTWNYLLYHHLATLL